MSTTVNRRKVLVPLATLAIAGAIAVGSGATFTSTTASTTAVSSGAVTHANDVSKLDIGNIKPGDTIKGTVTVTNTGSLDSTLSLRQVSATNGFVADDLQLTLTHTDSGTALTAATPFYTGDFAKFATKDLGALAADPDGSGPAKGGSATVQWAVTLKQSAANANEGKSATANYEWVSTQKAGEERSFVSSLPVIGD